MTLTLTICDDSALARKQLARALPPDLDIHLSFATQGHEALQRIRQGHANILLLDLNMPDMDGYQVLRTIREEDLPCLVIVISGDIQEAAKRQVIQLGALEFLAKPVCPEQLALTLSHYGLTPKPGLTPKAIPSEAERPVNLTELLQETMNVAMGQAGRLLGSLLNTFVHLPIPKVHHTPYAQLPGQLQLADCDQVAAVSQGFIGSGISGEAVLLLEQEHLPKVARFLPDACAATDSPDLDVLTELAALLSGACLRGFAEQLDLRFSLGHPVFLGLSDSVKNLLNAQQTHEVLAVEIDYRLPEVDIDCDLLMIFTSDSLAALNERTGYLG